MNILFINANLAGHINPTLGLVKKLIQRGNRVSYFCSESYSQLVTQMGAKWIGLSDKIEIFLRDYRPTDKHPFFMLMEYMLLYDEVVLPEILQMLYKEQYDMVICDSYFGGACFLKQMITRPVVCSHSSFAMSHTPVPKRMLVPGFHPQLDHCCQIVKRICDRYQIEEPSLEQVFTSKGDLNIIYTTCHFNGDEAIHEPEYLFAGPSLDRLQGDSAFDFFATAGRKLIYISLGSLNTDFIDFYKMCIEAFGSTDYCVYMSIGKKCDISQLGEIPINFTVRHFMPQLDILKHANLFITHAGFNSVNEALYFGVPMLALPQVNDQHMVAKRLVSMQLGMTENIMTLTPKILQGKVAALLMDEEIKENCMQIANEMRQFAKLEQVVIRLEAYAKERRVRC